MQNTDEDSDNGKGLIDRAYDKAESFVGAVGAMLGVDVNAPDPGSSVPPPRVGIERQIDPTATKALPPVSPPAPAAAVTVPPSERAFEIVEVLGKGGQPISWIVTNGIERAECASAETARAVLAHLAKRGARVGSA